MYGMSYLTLIIVTLALGMGAQAWINSSYKKWAAVPNQMGMSGAEAARRMLDMNGLQHVGITMLNKPDLSDYFDPTKNMLGLSAGVYNGRSVGAIAVACHEAGHAVQHAQNYMPAKARMALVPITNFASNAWMIIFFMGLFMNMLGLVQLAIVLYAIVLLFQVVTLPVEFDASRRGLAYIEGYTPLGGNQADGAKKVLSAAAFTYVAAALASLLQLLYFAGFARSE